MEVSEKEKENASMVVVGYPYFHPTLGEVTIDPELLELSFLYILVRASSGKDCPFIQFDYDTAVYVFVCCVFKDDRVW